MLNPARRVIATLLLAVGGGEAQAQTYRAIVIPSLPTATLGAALGVNDDGDAVGWMFFPGGVYHGFYYNRSTNTTIDIGSLGGSLAVDTSAYSVNKSGRVVGTFRNAQGRPASFTWTLTGGFVDISYFPPTQEPRQSSAFAIGDGGQIGGQNTFGCASSPTVPIFVAAGWSSFGAQPTPAVPTAFPCGFAGVIYGVNAAGNMAGETINTANGGTWTRPIRIVNGSATELPTVSSPAEHGVAYDISDTGWAAGYAENRAGTVTSSACVWSPGGTLTNLLASQFSSALAINTSKDTVGWDILGSTRHGVVWFNATPGPVDLNTRLSAAIPGGLVITTAEDISNTGFIAGRLNEQNSSARPVLLEPCTPGIVAAPLPQQPASGGTANFTVSAAGAGTLSFQWRRNTTPLTDGPTGNGSTISGAFSDTLTITGAVTLDDGTYDVVLTSACGSATSNGAALTVTPPPPCTADFNADHVVNVADLTYFLGRFGSAQPAGTNGDLNGDSVVNVADLTIFLGQFGRTNCP